MPLEIFFWLIFFDCYGGGVMVSGLLFLMVSGWLFFQIYDNSKEDACTALDRYFPASPTLWYYPYTCTRSLRVALRQPWTDQLAETRLSPSTARRSSSSWHCS